VLPLRQDEGDMSRDVTPAPTLAEIVEEGK
jgi:hypothetical protein